MTTHQSQAPTCSHGYTVYVGKHPNGLPCADAQLTGSHYVRAVVDQLVALDVLVDLNALDLDEEQCNIPIANFDEIVWLRWLDDPEHGWHLTTPGGERCAPLCAPDTPPAEAARIIVDYV